MLLEYQQLCKYAGRGLCVCLTFFSCWRWRFLWCSGLEGHRAGTSMSPGNTDLLFMAASTISMGCQKSAHEAGWQMCMDIVCRVGGEWQGQRTAGGTGYSWGDRGHLGNGGQPRDRRQPGVQVTAGGTGDSQGNTALGRCLSPGQLGLGTGRAATARQHRGTRAGIGANKSWEITVFSLTRPILRVISIWLRQKDRWPHCLS